MAAVSPSPEFVDYCAPLLGPSVRDHHSCAMAEKVLDNAESYATRSPCSSMVDWTSTSIRAGLPTSDHSCLVLVPRHLWHGGNSQRIKGEVESSKLLKEKRVTRQQLVRQNGESKLDGGEKQRRQCRGSRSSNS